MGADDSPAASWQSLLGMGAVAAALLVVGLGLGWLLDNALDTGPTFLLVGIAVGLVAGVVYTVGKFRQYLKT